MPYQAPYYQATCYPDNLSQIASAAIWKLYSQWEGSSYYQAYTCSESSGYITDGEGAT